MDKRTIKSIIVELRRSGKSFQEISDILKSEHNVIMSRQAICGMYRRLMSEKNLINDFNLMVSTVDIVNYSVIGLDANKIKDILASRNIYLTLGTINNTIKNESANRQEFYNSLVATMLNRVKADDDFDKIIDAISYKGEKPTEQVIRNLLYDCAAMEIRYNAVKTAAKLYNLTDDRTLLKNINKRFNLDVSYKDLSKIINT